MPNRAKQAKAKAKTRVKGSLGRSILKSSIKNTLSLSLSLVPTMDSFAWAAVSQTPGLAGGGAAGSDRQGGGFLPSMAGFHLPPPACLEHFSVDSGLVERAGRSPCFGAANGTATTASASNITLEGASAHRSKVAGGSSSVSGVHDEAGTGDCSSGGPEPDSKNMKRSNEVGVH